MHRFAETIPTARQQTLVHALPPAIGHENLGMKI